MDLTNPIFHDEAKARKFLEAQRWGKDGRYCPHCGATEGTVAVKGKSARPGLYYCNACKGQFTVTVGTLFERSKIGLHKWLMASHLLCSSKKGISTHQIGRTLGVTYKTAWFMTHRIRESMRELNPEPMGGGGQTVEADETYIGSKRKGHKNKHKSKEKVMGLVERGGKVRTTHVPAVNVKTVRTVLNTQLLPDTHLQTDQGNWYQGPGKRFASHTTVDHSIKEYVRGDAYTNTIEGYFSILKRGLGGVYQHVSAKHLKRYLGEFDFRYNTRGLTDIERTAEALQGITGKRLTYRRINAGA